MLYWLLYQKLFPYFRLFRIFRYLTFRTVFASLTALFIGMLIGPAVHNEVDPFILGMPFPLGWISIWVVLTAIIMAVVYLIDPANREDAP